MNQEKISLNLTAVDLAKVDYLVEQGFYSSRSDFLRSAIRNQLLQHQAVISDQALQERSRGTRTIGGVGIIGLGRRQLEKAVNEGQRLTLFVVGSLVVDKDITAELFAQAVESGRVYGVVKASPEVTALIKGFDNA